MATDQVTPGAGAATVVNANFEAGRAAMTYGRRASTTGTPTALTWGFYGGQFAPGINIADGTITLTNSATNYIVADRTTGVVSSATNTTNWLNTASYIQLYEVVAAGGVVTGYTDRRATFYAGTGGGGGGGQVNTVVAGAGIDVDATDPINPEVSLDAASIASLALADSALQPGDTIPAADVSIVDAGGYFTSTDVEGALQELGAGGGGGGQASIQMRDEGSNLGTAGTVDTIDFTGGGVAASRVGNVVTVTVAGGGAGVPIANNRLLNGGFWLNQRAEGNAVTITAAAALLYTLDCWYNYSTGANLSVSRGLSAGGKRRIAITANGSATAYLGQRIEAESTRDMAGSVASLQALISSTVNATVGWEIFYATTENTWGTVAAPTRTSIASGTFSVTSTETLFKSENITMPSGAVTGLEVIFSCAGMVNTQVLTFAEAKLEEGAASTPFETPPIATVLSDCERYCETTFPRAVAPATMAGVSGSWHFIQAIASGGTQGGNWVAFRTKKFGTPSVTTYNPISNNSNARMVSGSIDTPILNLLAYPTGFVFQITTPAGSGAGSAHAVQYVARSEL